MSERIVQPEFDEQTFFDEINSPVVIDDPYSHDHYRVHLLNRVFDGERPLVVYNGLGSTPNNPLGQSYLKHYAETIPRPLIAPLNIHLTRHTKRRDFADGHARAIESVTDTQVEIAGMSWGAVLGYSVAESLQDQANHLVTVSSVGVLNGLGRYGLAALKLPFKERRQLKSAAKDSALEAHLEDIAHLHPSFDQFDKPRRLRLIAQPSFPDLPATLHPNTTWHDVIGEHDGFTDPDTHYRTVLARNQRHPESSQISYIFNHGHLWIHIPSLLARTLRDSVERSETNSIAPIEYYRMRNDFSGIDQLPSVDTLP